jgi:hypothetical protein
LHDGLWLANIGWDGFVKCELQMTCSLLNRQKAKACFWGVVEIKNISGIVIFLN